MTRKETDVTHVAELWRSMTALCDEVLDNIRAAAHKSPQCCGPSTFDAVLDLRAEAIERAMVHAI
jgi:hypothetical protein